MTNEDQLLNPASLETMSGLPLSADDRIGAKLKTLRELYGYSQRELAKRAGITNSHISMIEQDQVSPSVHSLARILAAFPLSIEHFFAWDPRVSSSESQSIMRAAERPKADGPGVSLLELSGKVPAARLRVQQLDLPATAATAFAKAAGDIDLIAWIIAGEVQLSLAANVYTLGVGDCAYIHAQQLYRWCNATKQDARILICSLFGQG